MSNRAAVAAKEVIRSGIRARLLPGLGRGAVNGVAIGALLSGASFLLVTTPRRPRRARRRMGMFADPGRGIAGSSGAGAAGPGLPDPLGDETAEIILPPGVRSLTDPAWPAAPAWPGAPAWPAGPAHAGGPAAASDPAARTDTLPTDGAAGDGRRPGYRSKHRREEPGTGQWRPEPATSRPESRQRAPRHAAPPAGFGSRMASLLAVRPLAAAARN
ncbi:MAG: hypothetical protein ACLP70_08460 [Streptosporangiaceae bacterium]|jgi:hypothetical protein